jgi:ribosomal protein S18 acetylase RimI-like enzyme
MDSTTATARGAKLRAGKPEDAQELGRICYEAFASIAGKHNFPPDFPSPEVAAELMEMILSRPDVYSVVAEDNGKIVGSNFLWESDDIAGVGPITVDPAVQNSSLGRAMMEDVVRRADVRGFLAVRLVQAAYHNRSLALYTKLGFNTVEPLSNIQGDALNISFPGYEVRPMSEADVDAADRLCRSVHGHSRRNEIAGSLAHGLRDGRRTSRPHDGLHDRHQFFRSFGGRIEPRTDGSDRCCSVVHGARIPAPDTQ